MPVGGIELSEIARNTLLQLRPPPLDFAAREVLIAIIDGFELAAIDGDAGCREQPHLAAHLNEARADLFDAGTIVPAEVGNRFVIGRKPAEQPHHFDVAASFSLDPAARMHTVEIPVNVEP